MTNSEKLNLLSKVIEYGATAYQQGYYNSHKGDERGLLTFGSLAKELQKEIETIIAAIE